MPLCGRSGSCFGRKRIFPEKSRPEYLWSCNAGKTQSENAAENTAEKCSRKTQQKNNCEKKLKNTTVKGNWKT